MRTAPRPKIARCMTSAITMPSTSSIATETTVMITRVEDVRPPQARGEHRAVVGEADELVLVREAQVERCSERTTA